MTTMETRSYPVQYDVEYPEKLSRLLIFFKWLLAIPHFIVLYALSAVVSIMTMIAWFAILFTGRYPKGLFDFVVGVSRWSQNVCAYILLLRDEYPPFSFERGRYPVTYEVEYPEKLSRWLIFFKFLFVLPNLIVLALVMIAYYVTLIIAWFAILFSGRYPEGLFKFAVGTLRWSARVNAYVNLLRDEYPPFGMAP